MSYAQLNGNNPIVIKKTLALGALLLLSSQAMSQSAPVCPASLFVYDQFLFQAVEMSERFETRSGKFMCDKLQNSNAAVAVLGGYHPYGDDRFSINLTFALKDNRTGFISPASSHSVSFFAQEFMTDDQKREKAAQMINDALRQWSNGGGFQRAINEFDRSSALVKAKP